MDHRQFLRSIVFPERSYPAAAERLRLAEDVGAHSHDFVEIAVIVEGTAGYEHAGGELPLRRGMACAVRPGQWHAYRDCDGLDVINLYLGPELITGDLSWVLDHPRLARFLLAGGTTLPIDEPHLTALTAWLIMLAEHRSVQGQPSSATALGLACCALAELATAPYAHGSERPVISPVVRRALRLIGDEPAHAWRMAELAERLHISVPHLHRLFAAEVGTPPMRWLARIRAERAAAMLIRTDLPVGEVGRRVGWPDANYFSRQFRSLHGISPSGYRHRFRAPTPRVSP